MEEEAVEQLSKEILNDALLAAESDPTRKYEVSREGGHPKLIYRISGSNGGFVFAFFPDRLPEVFLTQAEELVSEIFNSPATVKGLTKEGAEKTVPLSHFRTGTPDAYTETFARLGLNIFIEGLHGKMLLALHELCGETMLMTQARLQAFIVDSLQKQGLTVVLGRNQQKNLKVILESTASERKDYLTRSLESFSGGGRFDQLHDHYQRLLPVWKEAKDIYEQNKKREKWQEMIRAAYPEICFPADLLSRLTGRLLDLPEAIQTKVAETGGDSKPSSLALEHSARMCGAAPYQIGIRQLYNLKKTARGKKIVELTESIGVH